MQKIDATTKKDSGRVGNTNATNTNNNNTREDDFKAKVMTAECPEEIKQAAIKISEEAVKKSEEEKMGEKEIASYIKKKFDEVHGPTWHCIVGRQFGSWVTHQHNRFIYIHCGHVAVLLFKSA